MTNGVLSTPEASLIDWVCPINWLSPLNRGLVSWWLNVPGMRGGSKWPDLCNRNPGTLTNMDPGTDWVGASGRPGGFGAVDFDGSDDYVSCGEVVGHGYSAITLAFWVYMDGTDRSTIVSRWKDAGNNDVFFCYWSGTGPWAVNFWVKNSSNATSLGSSTSDYSASTWAHYVCTWYDGSGAKVYKNGVASGSTGSNLAGPLKTPAAGTILSFSAKNGAGDYGKNSLDDIRIWERALSADEVLRLYNDSRTGYQGTLNWMQRGGVDAAAAPASFQAAWAAHSNVILQPGAVL